MAYRKDSDLEFLQECSNDDLDRLVEYLTLGQGGEPRIGESLTKRPLYRRHYPDHQRYWHNIAEELQLYGANTVVSIFRGNTGACYRNIAIDVARKFKCNIDQQDSIEEIEHEIILKMLTASINGMSPEELEQLVDQLNLDSANMSKEAIKHALLTGWSVGSKALVTITAGLLAKAIAVRIGFTTLAVVGGSAAAVGSTALSVLTGPIGIAALTGNALAGPAYRVTIPCVVQIAYMRTQNSFGERNSEIPQRAGKFKGLFMHG